MCIYIYIYIERERERHMFMNNNNNNRLSGGLRRRGALAAEEGEGLRGGAERKPLKYSCLGKQARHVTNHNNDDSNNDNKHNDIIFCLGKQARHVTNRHATPLDTD